MHAGGDRRWGVGAVENQPMSPPKDFLDLDVQKQFWLQVPKAPGLQFSPSPTLSVELLVWCRYTGIRSIHPPKDSRHWWLLPFYVSSLFFLLWRYVRYRCTVHSDHPHYRMWGPYMAVVRSWSQSDLRFQSSQLPNIYVCVYTYIYIYMYIVETVPNKECINLLSWPQKESSVWRGSCLGLPWQRWPGFLSDTCFPEDL